MNSKTQQQINHRNYTAEDVKYKPRNAEELADVLKVANDTKDNDVEWIKILLASGFDGLIESCDKKIAEQKQEAKSKMFPPKYDD